MSEETIVQVAGMTTKNCPYSGKTMTSGTLSAPGSDALYWLPSGAKLKGWLVSLKRVTESGSIVLGEASNFGFIAKRQVITYYCKECRCFIPVMLGFGD